jgi:hypothetical protein
MNTSYVITFGAGKWDSWGFGVSYCHYDHTLSINFIRWFAFVEVYEKRD